MATQGGKPRSFTLPRDSNLHTLLAPPAKEEQQTHNGEFMLDQAFGVKCLQGHSLKLILKHYFYSLCFNTKSTLQ